MRKSHKATDFHEHRVPIIYVSSVLLASDVIEQTLLFISNLDNRKPTRITFRFKIVLCKLNAIEQIGLGSKIARASVIT